MIAGVCGGLGRNFGIDPVLFRIGFVVLALSGGTGLLAYVALALILPRDSDAVDPAADRARLTTGIVVTIAIVIALPLLLVMGFIMFIAPTGAMTHSIGIGLIPGSGTLLIVALMVALVIVAARRR